MEAIELRKLSDQELDNLLQNQFKILQIIFSSEYGFERLSKRTLESFQNEALDIYFLFEKNKKGVKMKKANKIKLNAILSDLRQIPTDMLENFMRDQWMPFLNSLNSEEQEQALKLFAMAQLNTLSAIAGYLPEIRETSFRAVQSSLEKLTSISINAEPQLANA